MARASPPAARRRAGLSLRVALALLIASLLVPALALAALEYRRAMADRKAEIESTARSLARAAAFDIDRELSIRAALLRTLAASPWLAGGDLATLYAQARTVASGSEDWIVLVDATGAPLVNTRFPLGAELPGVGDREALLDVASSGQLSLSDLFIGAAQGRPLLSLSVPVADGRALSWRLLPATFNNALRQRLPPGWTAALTDRAGRWIARSEQADDVIGTAADPDLLPALSGDPQGFRRGVMPDGTGALAAWHRLDHGWTAVVLVPEAVALAGARRLDVLIDSLALFGALAIVLSLALAGWIDRQFRLLSDAAVAIAEGRQPRPVEPALREARDVAHALHLAADAAAAHRRTEDALRAAHDTFRYLVENSPFGVYAVDADFRLVQVSAGAQKVFANVRPLIGRDFAEVLRVVWAEPFASEAIARFRHTLETGEPYHAPSTVERRHDSGEVESYDWKIERVTLPDGRPGVVCHFYDLSERQRHEEQVGLLLREINHRAKNMLGLVQAIARNTAATDPKDFARRFSERIQALSASQDLLVKSEWKGVALDALIRSQLAHFADLVGTRILLRGPRVTVTANAAQNIGMAIHELATNAGKYGALSNAAGHVEIAWRLERGEAGDRFAMAWTETGGPPVAAPTRHGFGSTIIAQVAKSALGADVSVTYAASGLRWRLDCAAGSVLEGEAAGEPAAPAAAPRDPPRCVLVVEDDALLAMEITAVLNDAGYGVLGPAHSVGQALRLLERSRCDAAVLDVNLGRETSEPIARALSGRGTPFVIVSGYSREQQPAAFQGAPFVGKPLQFERLVAELKGAVGAG